MMPHTGKGNVNTPKVKDSISSKKMVGLETLFFKIVKNIGVETQLKVSMLQAPHCRWRKSPHKWSLISNRLDKSDRKPGLNSVWIRLRHLQKFCVVLIQVLPISNTILQDILFWNPPPPTGTKKALHKNVYLELGLVTLDDLHLQDHLNISVLITHTEWKSVHFQTLDIMKISVGIIENDRTVQGKPEWTSWVVFSLMVAPCLTMWGGCANFF